MKRLVSAVVAAALLAGCASQPDQISAQYVSPVMYQGWSCDQIRTELERVSVRVREVTGQQHQKATNDAIAMTVGLVIFWPALIFIGMGQDQKDELGRLKGEYDALNTAAAAGHCTYAPPPQAVVGQAQPAPVASK